MVREIYPSDLPADVVQRVIWIRDPDFDNRAIAEFIANIMIVFELTLDDIILFERSRVSTTELVRAAVPEFRHIHLWTRKKNNGYTWK